MMAVVVLALLVLLLGAAALASRMSFSWLGSIGQSDYRAAKEAAEYGFSEVISRLNTNTHGHLYVTEWGEWNTVTVAELKNCNIAAENLTDAQLSPATIVGTQNLPNNIGQYELVNYTPPAPLRLATPSARNVCSSAASPFGNLFGGSGTVRVVGRARRANGTVATYTLERKIHVGSVVGGTPATNTSLASLGCQGGGSGANAPGALGNVGLWFDTNRNGTLQTGTDEDLGIICVGNCFQVGGGAGSAPIVAPNLQVPPFPVRPPELSGVTRLNVVDGVDQTDSASPITIPNLALVNYPYRDTDNDGAGNIPTGTVANGDLRPECRLTNNNEQISCAVNNIYNTAVLVHTSQALPPVNIFLDGNIANSAAQADSITGQMGNTALLNTGVRPATVDASGSTTIPNVDNVVDASLWKKLRLFGLPRPAGAACDVCNGQYVTIRGDNRLHGLFAWTPYGTVQNGAGGGTSTAFGVFWTCKFRSQSANYRILGPLNETNVDELEAFLRDILSGGTDAGGTQQPGSGLVGTTSATYRSTGG